MSETWKPIPGMPGYEASSLGHIRSSSRVIKHGGKVNHSQIHHGCMLRTATSSTGYMTFRAPGSLKTANVHSVVALAFLGERPAGFVVDHIDGNPRNNAVCNLRYVKQSINGLNKKNAKGYQMTKSGTFRASIKHNGKTICLGAYRTAKKASQVVAAVRAIAIESGVASGDNEILRARLAEASEIMKRMHADAKVDETKRDDLARRLEAAERELSRWKKSFGGHVYVSDGEYSALIQERDRLKADLAAEREFAVKHDAERSAEIRKLREQADAIAGIRELEHRTIKELRASLAAMMERAEKAEAAQRLTQKAREDDRGRLQQKCSDWGTYWRASDSHGVKLNIAQAVELLADALGVEVEIEVESQRAARAEAEAIRSDALREREANANCATDYGMLAQAVGGRVEDHEGNMAKAAALAEEVARLRAELRYQGRYWAGLQKMPYDVGPTTEIRLREMAKKNVERIRAAGVDVETNEGAKS